MFHKLLACGFPWLPMASRLVASHGFPRLPFPWLPNGIRTPQKLLTCGSPWLPTPSQWSTTKITDRWLPMADWLPMASLPMASRWNTGCPESYQPVASHGFQGLPMASPQWRSARPKSLRPVASHGFPSLPSGVLHDPTMTDHMASHGFPRLPFPWLPGGALHAPNTTDLWRPMASHGFPVGCCTPQQLPTCGLPWPRVDPLI
jgi:hypothetical protein